MNNQTDCATKKYRGLNKIARRDGTGFDYFPRGVKGHGALPGEYGSPEFDAAYAALQIAKPGDADKNLGGLLTEFEKTAPQFAAYSKLWQYDLRGRYTKIRARRSSPGGAIWATLTYAELESMEFRDAVIKWRDEIASSVVVDGVVVKKACVRAADMLVTNLCTVLQWATGTKLKVNVLANIKKLYVSHRVDARYTIEDLRKVRTNGAPWAWHAVLTGIATGQREGDLLRLKKSLPYAAGTPAHVKKDTFDGTCIWLEQRKTRKKKVSEQKLLTKPKVVPIPCVPALLQMLNGLDRKPGEFMLQSVSGQGWSNGHFAQTMARELDRVGVEDLNFNDLRGSAITWLCDMGCTEAQIRSITGHSLQTIAKVLELYLGRTEVQANEAIAKLSAHPAMIEFSQSVAAQPVEILVDVLPHPLGHNGGPALDARAS